MSRAVSLDVKQPELEAEHSRELMPRLRMRDAARQTPCTVLSYEVKGSTFRSPVFEKLGKNIQSA